MGRFFFCSVYIQKSCERTYFVLKTILLHVTYFIGFLVNQNTVTYPLEGN